MLKIIHILILINDENPKFKVGDHVRIFMYQNIFATSWSEEVFVVSKIKNTVPWTYVINDLNGEEIVGTFFKKELQKTNEKEFKIEKGIERKCNKLYVKWKGYDNSFDSWINKKDLMWFCCIEMSKYYPKPYRSFGGNIKVKVDLSNYAAKTDIKNISLNDTSSFALKTNLSNLKAEADKLGIDKLVPVPVDVSKLSDVVKNNVVKKDVCDKLVIKVNNIDTSGFVLRTKYDTDKSKLENKIPDTRGLVKKTGYNTKIAGTKYLMLVI